MMRRLPEEARGWTFASKDLLLDLETALDFVDFFSAIISLENLISDILHSLSFSFAC